MPNRRLAAAAAGTGLAVLLAGGCAAIPSHGTYQSTRTPPALVGLGRAAGFVPIMRPPLPNWDPQTVVQAFLLASAFGRSDRYTVARQYLTSAARRSWRPGTQITILADNSSNSSPRAGRQDVTGQGNTVTLVTWPAIGTLSSAGQYVRMRQAPEAFSLQLDHGHYLINGLPAGSPQHPSHALFLTSYLFHLVYTSRNVYYYGQRNGSLVPYPVFVPVWYTDPATTLIDALQSGPTGWLRQAATTAFPPGTPPPSFGVLPGPGGSKIAVVGLRLPAHIGAIVPQEIAAQLTATLTSPTYTSPPLFQAVRIKINGRPFYPPHSRDPLLRPGELPRGVPHWRVNAPLYYLTATGSPRVLGYQASQGVPLPGAPGGLSQLAVSPNGKYVACVAPPAATVYTGSLAAGGSSSSGHPPAVNLRSHASGSAFTGLSWDAQGDLWVAGRMRHSPGLWVLPSGHGPPVPVQLPAHTGPVTAVRVAPDGVRVALIAGAGASAQLMLGAIVRTAAGFAVPQLVPLGPGLAGVTSLTWYNEDYLLVVTRQPGKRGTQSGLWAVPANGDSANKVSGQPGMLSVTADGPSPLYLSLTGGRVWKSVGLREQWTYVTAGKQATYPG